MRARDAQDRLAVWTYQQAGEEIPIGLAALIVLGLRRRRSRAVGE